MDCAGALEVSNPHPPGAHRSSSTDLFEKPFLLLPYYPYYSFSLNILFKKGEIGDAGP